MPPTAANLAALVVALLAACAALWLDLDAVQPLRRLLDSWQSPASSSVSDEAAASPQELDFNALRAHSAALSDDALRWGTYRSGLYHGIRSRTFPYSVSAGLLWGSGHEDVSQLRHECRQEDRLQKYGWLHHDGRRYGWQSVEDQFNRVDLHTLYVRLADQRGWASRFSVVALEPNDERLRKKVVATTKLSLFFYVDLGCGDESVADACRRQLQGLMDVASDLSEGPCGDSDDSFACASVAFESEGVDEKYKDGVDGPFAFQLLAQLKTRADASRIRQAELRFAGLKDATVLNVKERLVALATRSSPQEDEEITLDNTIEEDSTLLVIQATIEFDATQGAVERGDIELDIVFQETSESGATLALSPRAARELVDAKLPQYRKDFEDKFEETFHLATNKGYNASEVAFAQAAFSNLLGGTGFFYGKSLVQRDPFQPEIEETPPAPLFTAVPSRSFFPRGFLWDDGFHQLGISTFDDEISRDVLVHWLGLMNDSGYIAREQILGKTARRRVPNEFIVQHVEHANPPTLLLTLDKVVAQWEAAGGFTHEAKSYVKLVFPFLDRWYTWFAATQRGPLFQDDIATTQWRGRHTDDGKLIANTLSSGLDDYPRASTPSGMEMHLDLLCWMIKASDLLASLGSKIGLDANRIAAFQHDKQRYLAALDAVHWSDESQSYFDVGEHSAGGHIAQHVVVRCRNEETGQTRDTTATYEQLEHQQVRCPSSHPRFLFPLGDGQGGLKMQPVFVAESPAELQHVKHIGYVSLFPLLLEIVAPESPKLGALLEQLASPDHLWSPFGLRSLSTQDLFYEQANAHGDNPYWRGSIWINLNYLALKALHHYGELDGPFQQRARELYAALRGNVVSTIHGEYERTGYLWEQYSGNIHAGAQYGRGQRCHPFSGWTALVVNIMAEKY